MWTLQRLADYLAEQIKIRVSYETVRRLQSTQLTMSSPDPEYQQKKTIEETRDGLKPGEVFYYADEFNLSWLPTLRTMWSSVGQQVMLPTPGQQHT